MLNSLAGFFNRTSLDEKLEHKNPKNAKNIIYRDELSKVKQTKKVKFLESSEPLIKKDSREKIHNTTSRRTSLALTEVNDDEEKRVIRVKVTMTKQEAARLLSKCKDGGVLDFKDVARELVEIPASRVAVDRVPPISTGKVLKSIPEEF